LKAVAALGSSIDGRVGFAKFASTSAAQTSKESLR